MEIYCIGVYKCWWTRGNVKHPRAKKHWMAFFWTDTGKFFSRNISKIDAMMLKRQVKKQIKMTCTHCGSKFNTLKDFAMDYVSGIRKCPVCLR